MLRRNKNMGFFDKLSDATLTTAKALFEKDCTDFYCYSLEDISKRVYICAKILDKDNNLIQFSGNVLVDTKSILGRKFFVDNQNRILDVDFETVEVKDEEIQQKSKVSHYETTTAKFQYKKLDLV